MSDNIGKLPAGWEGVPNKINWGKKKKKKVFTEHRKAVRSLKANKPPKKSLKEWMKSEASKNDFAKQWLENKGVSV